VPVLAKGQGVTLQRYRDGGLSDIITLKFEDGLSWQMGGETGRTRVERPASWRGAGPRAALPRKASSRQQVSGLI
jgi:topoisomerase-4 subunit A